MADVRSALEGVVRPGAFGRTPAEPGVRLGERRGLALLQVAGFRAGAVAAALRDRLGIAVDAEPNRASGMPDAVALWLGPERWLVVTPAGRTPAAAELLSRALPSDQAGIVDLGHARTVLRLSGAKARDVLAKGCLLDLHPRAFGPGACAQTALFHANALIHVVDAAAFDLYVPRSYAQSFWESLTDAAGEFGWRVEA
jgi:sarcosine oxidase subunit gamma